MAIKHYPNRIFTRGKVPAIDGFITPKRLYTQTGFADISTTALGVIVSCDEDPWKVISVSLGFGNTTSRNFSIGIQNGRKVISRVNDSMWISVEGIATQVITLDEGFYTGTQLAQHLATKLDSNAAFLAATKTFSVVYDNVAGTYTVTPSSGNIRYLDVNLGVTHQYKDSICGHLFGFTADSTYAASLVSDTIVAGLNDRFFYVTETASGVLTYYSSTEKTLSVDQGLLITTNAAATTVHYSVVYEKNL